MPKRAVLLANLGSPDSTSVADVSRYLREFLGDERVIDKPDSAFLRRLLVNRIIVPKRAANSAHAYESVWTKEGSPLIVTSRAVQKKLADRLGAAMPVYFAMRYGSPSIASVVAQMSADGIEEVLLFSQYPQYAMSSWETVAVKVFEEAAKIAPGMRIDCVQPFYDDADYIEALYASTRPYLEQPYDFVLFSYHGLPERHLRKADSSNAHCTRTADCCTTCSPAHQTCYRAQCVATTRAFVRRAGLASDKYAISFQSRLVGEPWLYPYTDYELERLPKSGVKNLVVMTPAFVADCLETLEEIAEAGKKSFLDAGGASFQHVPCLNDQTVYIDFLAGRVSSWLAETSSADERSRYALRRA